MTELMQLKLVTAMDVNIQPQDYQQQREELESVTTIEGLL
jgi:hypothetical protein